jgi:hypothetical protein
MTFLSSLTFKTIFLKMEAWENNMHVLKMSEREYWEVSNEQAINMINEFFTGDNTGIIDSVINKRKPIRVGNDIWLAADKDSLESIASVIED